MLFKLSFNPHPGAFSETNTYDIFAPEPVHFRPVRVRGYCIFLMDVVYDMAITDAGHESGGPEPPCLLMSSTGATVRYNPL